MSVKSFLDRLLFERDQFHDAILAEQMNPTAPDLEAGRLIRKPDTVYASLYPRMGKSDVEQTYQSALAEVSRLPCANTVMPRLVELFAVHKRYVEAARSAGGRAAGELSAYLWKYRGMPPESWNDAWFAVESMLLAVEGVREDVETPGDWITAADAIKRAEALGYEITAPGLSRANVTKRPARSGGRARCEVEWGSVAAYLLKTKKPKRKSRTTKDTDEPKGKSKVTIEASLKTAREEKAKSRRLD